MSEADLREGLRAAVGDEPPLDFDPDELIRRGRHVRRRRRALVAVAVATLALTGTVVALPGVLDQRRGVDAASGSLLTTAAAPSVAEAPTPPPSPAAQKPAITTPPSLAGAKRDAPAYLTKAFAEVVPRAKVVSAEAVDSGPGHLFTWLVFIDGSGSSRVMVRLAPPSAGMTRDHFCADTGCEGLLLQPDGSYVTSSWQTTSLPDPEGVMHTVVHFRLDGSVVEVRGFGYEKPVDGVVREKVALTYDQLAALATDPRLRAP